MHSWFKSCQTKVPFVSHYGTILFPAWTVGIISCLYSNGKYFSTNENSDCLSVINPCLEKKNKQTNKQNIKISLIVLLTLCYAILLIVIGSTKNPLIDMFLYSNHLFAWCCDDNVGRSSNVITHWSYEVKHSYLFCLCSECKTSSTENKSGETSHSVSKGCTLKIIPKSLLVWVFI